MIKQFDIVELVRVEYSCTLPDKYSTVEEFAEAEGIGAVFEASSHGEIIDYLEHNQETISES